MKRKLLMVVLAVMLVFAVSAPAMAAGTAVPLDLGATDLGSEFRAAVSGSYNYNPSAATLKLTSDLTLADDYYLEISNNSNKPFTINLNGYNILGNVDPYDDGVVDYYGMVMVKAGAVELSGTGTISNQANAGRETVIEVITGSLSLSNATIEGGYAVTIYPGNSFTMHSGKIAGDVYVLGSSFTMYGGSIATTIDGLTLHDNSEFIMYDGNISGSNRSLGIYNSKVIMEGGIITGEGNTVFVVGDKAVGYGAEFIMKGGSIKGGIAVSLYHSEFTLVDGEITGTFSEGVSMDDSSFTMHGGSITANGEGACGIYSENSRLLFADIEQIDIHGQRRGIYCERGSTLTFDNIQSGQVSSDNIAILVTNDKDYIEPIIKDNTNYRPEIKYLEYNSFGGIGYATSFADKELEVTYDEYGQAHFMNAADTVYFSSNVEEKPAIDDWVLAAAAAGYYATGQPYITGFPDGTFRAGNNVTRGQISTMFSKAAKLSTGIAAGNYIDVKASDWDNIYIAAVSNAGVAKGYPDGTFRSLNKVTFAEAITMAVRAFNLSNTATTNAPYDGIATHWAKDAVNAAHAAGWLQSLGSFRLDAYANRGQVVLLINAAAGLNSKTIVEYGPSFSDVPAGHSLYDAVTRASSKLR